MPKVKGSSSAVPASPADAREDAEDQAEHHAGGEEQQAKRVHQDEESVTRRVEHAAVHAVTLLPGERRKRIGRNHRGSSSKPLMSIARYV